MITRTLGKTEMKVSSIIYGGIVSTMGGYAGYTYDNDGQKASDEYVQYALDAGINYFDAAPKYGDAQERLGNSIKGVRDNVYLACKTGHRDYDSAARDFEKSLKLLHTDYFDVYQLHALGNGDDVDRAFDDNGVMKLMEEIKKSGAARFLGITAHSESAALKAMGMYDFDTLLFSTNWQMNMAMGYGDRALKLAKDKGMGIIGMKSMVERGFQQGDEEYREKWPKSWCKPFDVEQQSDILLAAMKYSVSMNPDSLVPTGDIEHFRFAVEHSDEIWKEALTEEEKGLLKGHLNKVRDALFMPEADR